MSILKATDRMLNQAALPHSNLNSLHRCYGMFRAERADTDKLALELGFFLASWGMMRGSSFLSRLDHTVHHAVVAIVRSAEARELRGAVLSEKNIPAILKIKSRIEKAYRIVRKNVGPLVSDTLSSKIMLGTLGCVPAYDRFFKEGVAAENISRTFSERSLAQLLEHVSANGEAYAEAQAMCHARGMDDIPVMRLVDTYFWYRGYMRPKFRPRADILANDELD